MASLRTFQALAQRLARARASQERERIRDHLDETDGHRILAVRNVVNPEKLSLSVVN
jgi:hypothetical protein